jgi:hypothetical protein
MGTDLHHGTMIDDFVAFAGPVFDQFRLDLSAHHGRAALRLRRDSRCSLKVDVLIKSLIDM